MKPLINRVVLKNYKSIAACDVFLGPLIFLVGPNGSGKSNFLDALRFVSGALHYNFGLDGAIQSRGGAKNIRRRGSESFRIELTAQFESGAGRYELEIAPADNGGFRVIEESCETSHNASESRYSAKNGQLVEGDERLKSAAEDGLVLPLARNLPEFSNLSRALREFRLYSPHPPDIAAEKDEKAVFLDRTGSKTAPIFDRLDEKTQRRVNQYLDAVVPGVSARAVSAGSLARLEFSQKIGEDKAPWQFNASDMSDGTLRALAILVAIFQKQGLPGFYGIEEPEAAIHPSATAVLLDAMREASSHSQIICTSHSADLLDNSSVEIEEIRAAYFENGESIISELDSGSVKTLRERLTTAGELLRMNQLHPREMFSRNGATVDPAPVS